MSLITRFRTYGKCIVLSLAVVIIVLFLINALENIDFGIKIQQIPRKTVDEENNIEKTLVSQELSPDNSDRVIRYMLEFDPEHFSDYYRDYFSNKAIISVENQESLVKRTIFTGEGRIGDPHWLGNDYIYFSAYCGTSCQGYYLINVRSKETSVAVLSFMMPTIKKKEWYTHFRDWFDEEFEFSGLPENIYAEMQDGKPYLIFEMEDDEDNILGKERLLFTGDSLEEE